MSDQEINCHSLFEMGMTVQAKTTGQIVDHPDYNTTTVAIVEFIQEHVRPGWTWRVSQYQSNAAFEFEQWGTTPNSDILRLVRHALVRELRPGGQSSPTEPRQIAGARRQHLCPQFTGGDRPGSGPGGGPVVRDEVVDRSGIPTAEARRLAVASDADDRSGSGGAVVAGAGGGDAVRAGGGCGGRRGGVRRRDDPRASGPIGPVGHRAAAGIGCGVGGHGRGVAVGRRGRLPPESRGGGGPGRSSAWSASSVKAWRS